MAHATLCHVNHFMGWDITRMSMCNIDAPPVLSLRVSRDRYEEVPDTGKLISLLEDYLDEYNLSSTNALNLGA